MGFRVAVTLTRSLTATLVLVPRLFSLGVLYFLVWIAHGLWKCTRRAFVAVYSIRMDCSSYSHAYTYFCFYWYWFLLWWLWVCSCGCECAFEYVWVCMWALLLYIQAHGEQKMCDYAHRNQIKIRLSIRIVFCLFQYNIRSWGNRNALRYNICVYAFRFGCDDITQNLLNIHIRLVLIGIRMSFFLFPFSPRFIKICYIFFNYICPICTKSSPWRHFTHLLNLVWQINELNLKLGIFTGKYVPFHCLNIFFSVSFHKLVQIANIHWSNDFPVIDRFLAVWCMFKVQRARWAKPWYELESCTAHTHTHSLSQFTNFETNCVWERDTCALVCAAYNILTIYCLFICFYLTGWCDRGINRLDIYYFVVWAR